MHGICHHFFVTGQIYVDNEAPKEIRANAQGFIAMITYGGACTSARFWRNGRRALPDHGRRPSRQTGRRCDHHDHHGAVAAVAFALFFQEKRKLEAAPSGKEESETA